MTDYADGTAHWADIVLNNARRGIYDDGADGEYE